MNDSGQVMVYGWGHCKYGIVADTLNNTQDPEVKSIVQKAFKHSVIDPNKDVSLRETIEKRMFEEIPCTGRVESECKAALVALILENYKRKKTGLPIIPLIFLYDCNDNPYQTNVTSIYTRNLPLNNSVGNSELRRMYKLVDLVNDSSLREIGEIAEETFKFIQINIDDKTLHTELKLILPFWNDPKCEEAFKEREAIKPTKLKASYWKLQLATRIETFNNSLNIKN